MRVCVRYTEFSQPKVIWLTSAPRGRNRCTFPLVQTLVAIVTVAHYTTMNHNLPISIDVFLLLGKVEKKLENLLFQQMGKLCVLK
jgi:hypothetical protein